MGRQDGRPEAYAVNEEAKNRDETYICMQCMAEGKQNKWRPDQIFILEAHFWENGQQNLCCHGHLPDDTAIFDPKTGLVHDKQGNPIGDGTTPV